ncbi:IS630 transposase-related protein [Psychrobacter sp. LV10R520-6]|uniref:IS630 transposase-related protein n=1 Tax=Psychrobacter sp. LV10R520-6 TaxID=1415574 RepID=UPI0024C8AC91|nr:IS630 transposase-related protein [Psychrobacter sp. LV10R520-6]SNT70969.1 Transposase [Psychrobacter sp. LV10R520-6]
MTYSTDFRQLVLSKIAAGQTVRRVAQDWKKDVPKKPYYRKPTKIDDEALKQDVATYPDAYQYERAQRFNCTARGIGKALKRINITQTPES